MNIKVFSIVTPRIAIGGHITNYVLESKIMTIYQFDVIDKEGLASGVK
jgi:hypothetical protein